MLAERGTRDQAAVRSILERVNSDDRNSLTTPEAKAVCDAYELPVPQEALATSADRAAKSAESDGDRFARHSAQDRGVIVGVYKWTRSAGLI
jgi:acyl-CoA synthetase (NDP forming)